ncbi:major facilitator superfamily domain-containing protein [Phaeosphaeria sp. MPI-PUGE-AT-0046c]|nr:major facilitator superfamily domain-containing protein [Phaeosphaeria sp. MPI-PUGE-AT-0046c]
MDPEKSPNLSLPVDTQTRPVSGATTPDLIADEKENQKSYEPSTVGVDEATQDDATIEEFATGKRLVPVVVALVFSVFLIAIDMTIIGTAIPKITSDFDGLNMVSWYGSVYFLTFGGFQPASGKFFKYFPLKPAYLGSIFIFVIGSLICAVSQNSVTFVVGRAVAGFGAAGVATGAFTLITFVAEPKVRPGLIGMMGAVYGLSSVVGPILGGVFTDRATWRWCFYINLPIGGLSALLIFIFFKTPPQAKPVEASWKEKFLQLDPLGVSLIMGGICSFILAVEYGGQKKPWSSSTVIGLFVGFVLIWATFIAWEYYNNDRAMLQRAVISKRWVWMPSVFQFFFAAPYFVLLYYLPIYFQSVDNRSAISSGVLNLPLVLSLALGSTMSGILVMKTGHAAPMLVIGAVLSSVSCGLMYTFDVDTSIGKWIGYQLFYGFAIGMSFQMGITIAQANASIEVMSAVTATVLFFQTIGGAFSTAAAQSGFVNRVLTELAKTAPEIDPQKVIATGATQIRTAFPPDQVSAVVLAYMAGIKVTLAIAVGLTSFACLLAFLVPRKRINADAIEGAVA